MLPDVQGLLDWVLRDPRLVEYCASAVDQFEVAARLETFGLSARVVRTSFGFSDVFAAGGGRLRVDPLYGRAAGKRSRDPKMGNAQDLLRGALYAVPAIFVSVVILSFHLSAFWWLLPVGLTVAWGTTQAFTVLSWSLRDRKDHRSDAVLAASSIVFTAVASRRVARCARATWRQRDECRTGGRAERLYRREQHPDLPRRGTPVVALSGPWFHSSVLSLDTISDKDATWWILASGVLVVSFALGPVVSKSWQRPTFSSSTKRQAGKFLLYGLGCGLLTSAVIGFATHSTRSSGSVAIAAGPLLVTLGLMEWQLRSLRSRTALALRETTDLRSFSRRPAAPWCGR